MFGNRKKDNEWQNILDELNIDFPIENTGDFKRDYFRAMGKLIEKIKNNPYKETICEEDKKQLKTDLYILGCMFYGYRSKVNDYYAKYDKKHFEEECVPRWETDNGFLPTSHNYNTYLQYITPALLEHYYMRQVGVIEEFVESFGKQPSVLYELRKGTKSWFVQKLCLFKREDVPLQSNDLRLPDYYVVNGELATLEHYNEVFAKYGKGNAFERFLKAEYPVLKWIDENKKETIENGTILACFLEKNKNKVLTHIASFKDNDVIDMVELSYYYGIPREEVVEILDELIGDEEHGGKVLKFEGESGIIMYTKYDTFSPVGKSYYVGGGVGE